MVRQQKPLDQNKERIRPKMAKQLKQHVHSMLDFLNNLQDHSLRRPIFKIFRIFSFPKAKRSQNLRLHSQEPLTFLHLVIMFFIANISNRTQNFKRFLNLWKLSVIQPSTQNFTQFLDRIDNMLQIHWDANPGVYLPKLLKAAYGYRSEDAVNKAVENLLKKNIQNLKIYQIVDDLINQGNKYPGYTTFAQVIQKIKQCAKKQTWGKPLQEPPVPKLDQPILIQAGTAEQVAMDVESPSKVENSIVYQQSTKKTMVSDVDQYLTWKSTCFWEQDSDPRNHKSEDEYETD